MEFRKGKNLEKTPKAQGGKKIIRDKNIPFGREAVKAAILDAAEKLLLERSPNEITVREIAKLANIKHPLIHRHFGTKDKVIFAVHTRGTARINQNIPEVENIEGNIESFFRAIFENKWRQIALARAMIDGVNPYLLQNQFPVMQRIVGLLKKRQNELETEGTFEPEILASAMAAMGLGWLIYEPFLLAATNLEDRDKAEVRQKIVEILEDMIQKFA